MAQNALTVLNPNPTPPHNFACAGGTPPSICPNFTKNTYNDPKNWSATNPKDFPPPYYDDGTAGSGTAFAANVAALASGSGATAGGTEGTYPGTGSPAYTNPNNGGAVPASTSTASEGAGTEVVVTQTYNPVVYNPAGPLQTFSDLGNYVGLSPTSAGVTTGTANQQHASSLSPATNPTLSSISPTTAVSGASGTVAVTATTVGATRQSVIYANGVAVPTTFVSSTSLTANIPKKTSAGTWPITVVTGNVITTASQTFTWT